MYDLIIDRGNGEEYLNEILPYVKLQSFSPEAPIANFNTTTTPYHNGLAITKQRMNYTERKITITVLVNSPNAEQYYFWRDEIYRLFLNEDPYYVTTTFQPYKRWKVICLGNFDLAKDNPNNYKSVSIEVTAIEGFSQSKYTTEDYPDLSDDKFGIGMNIGTDKYQYSFQNQNAFSVYNLSDIPIYTTQHDFTVDMVLTGKNIQITNRMTGEFLKINESLNNNDVKIIRQYVLIDEESGPNVNGRFPSLVKGRNDFQISGATKSTISFVLRFYYK